MMSRSALKIFKCGLIQCSHTPLLATFNTTMLTDPKEPPFKGFVGTIHASHLRSFIHTSEEHQKRKIQEWYLIGMSIYNDFLICNTDHKLFWRATRIRHQQYPKSYCLAVEENHDFDINDDKVLAASPSAMRFSLETRGNGQYYIHSKINGLKGLLPNTTVVQAGWGEDEPQLGDELIIDAQNVVNREIFLFQNDPKDCLNGQ